MPKILPTFRYGDQGFPAHDIRGHHRRTSFQNVLSAVGFVPIETDSAMAFPFSSKQAFWLFTLTAWCLVDVAMIARDVALRQDISAEAGQAGSPAPPPVLRRSILVVPVVGNPRSPSPWSCGMPDVSGRYAPASCVVR